MPLKLLAKYRISGRPTAIIETVEAEGMGAGSRSNFSVDRNMLFYRALRVKEFERGALVVGERLYVVEDELEVYELPHTDRLVAEDGTSRAEYRQGCLRLNGKSLRHEAEVREVLMANGLLYLAGASSLLVLDMDLNELKCFSFLDYCYSNGCFMIKAREGVLLVEEAQGYPVDEHQDNQAASHAPFGGPVVSLNGSEGEDAEATGVLAFLRHEKWLYLWGTHHHVLYMRKYRMKESSFVHASGFLYSSGVPDLILSVQGVRLCTTPSILCPLVVGAKVVGGKVLLLAVTGDRIFMEYEGLCAYKSYSGHVYEADLDACVVHLLDSVIDLHDLYLTLCLRTHLPIPFNIPEIEAFLFRLFLFTGYGMEFIDRLRGDWEASRLASCGGGDRCSSLDLILYRLYRKVDDRGKRMLHPLVSGINNLQHMKTVIIYFPDKLEEYLNYCIDSRMEYEIEDIIEHYRGSSSIEAISEVLLRRNCFHLFCMCRPEFYGRFKIIAEVERHNSRTQRNKARGDGSSEQAQIGCAWM
jgi:hypothetical protein